MDELDEVFTNAVRGFFDRLLGFRTALKLGNTILHFFSGWIDPLLYRDMGERLLRGYVLVTPGLFVVGILLLGRARDAGINGPGSGFWPVEVTKAAAMHGVHSGAGTVLMSLLVAWSIGLGMAEWLGARARRRRGEPYVYSRFIGWPRLLPAETWAYPVLPLCVAITGLFLITHQVAAGVGVLLLITGLGVLGRLWIMQTLLREDALDMADAEWMAAQQQQAVALERGVAAPNRAGRLVASADLIRRFSSK